MRFVLMQLFHWSPHTFHTVWNAGNCDIYVLKKDMSLPMTFPYKLDPEGDMPKSTATVVVELLSGDKKKLGIQDYLAIPAPRTEQVDLAKRMIQEQHGID